MLYDVISYMIYHMSYIIIILYIYLEHQTTIVEWMETEAKDYENTETNSPLFWMIKIPYFKSSC